MSTQAHLRVGRCMLPLAYCMAIGAGSCTAGDSSDTTGDARIEDAPSDASAFPERAVSPIIIPPVPDVIGDQCTSFGEITHEDGGGCLSPWTGCPSQLDCYRGFFFCECTNCDLPLPVSDCSWRLEGEGLLVRSDAGAGQEFSLVTRINSQGPGRTTLSRRVSLDACGESTGWYYVSADPNLIEIALCPASCDEQRGGTATFVLGRFGCPLT
jgi:hypothetical protein